MTFTPKWRFDLVLAVIIGVWFGVGRLLFRHLDIDVFDVRRVRQGIKLLYRTQPTIHSTSDVERRSGGAGYNDPPDFGSFPVEIAGKTGTAEKSVDPGDGIVRNFSQSWWCGYGPYANPSIVVCAVIENGGHGGTAAAPAALRVFESYFHVTAGQQGVVRSD